MKLQDLYEDAAPGTVSAHDAAGSRGSLFSGGVLSPTVLKRKLPKMGHIMKLEFNKRNKVAGVEVMKLNSGD